MWHTKNAFFREMQFWSHCYTVGSYQALFRLSVYKFPAVYLLGAKNVCFCTIRDFGSPTTTDLYQINFAKVHNSRGTKVEKMLTLAPERYTAGFCMVAKVILWCI